MNSLKYGVIYHSEHTRKTHRQKKLHQKCKRLLQV